MQIIIMMSASFPAPTGEAGPRASRLGPGFQMAGGLAVRPSSRRGDPSITPDGTSFGRL
jgi:hypothetical protein